MKLRPINGHIIVNPLKPKEITVSGIYIPETAQEKVQEGKVIAIAKDAIDEVTIGDRIIYKDFSGTEIKIEDINYILLTEDDILAKYEEVDKIPE
jgi:chaperonin GroES